ncbi:MAG: cysteine synthase A [Clostridia bacterium]|jgi:cysteine synthase A|nr:cysteine synthase A [Clostridia bacterium]
MAGYTSMIQTIGNTPLLELRRYQEQHKLKASIFAKLEGFNPAGSVKDRVALAMIEDAEQKGKLRSDSVIIEPTSGNTGIGLAAVACAKGYRVVLTMPDTMSAERRNLLKAYGAELVLTDGEKGMEGAIERARELARTIEGAFLAGQFENPVNPQIHYQTTGPEIWKDLNGNVDVFVACVGTGGTLTGVGKFLKEQNPAIKIVAVEPENSPVLSGGKAGTHKIQGIGAGFLPQTLDVSVFDEVIAVSDETAIETGKEIAPSTGILAGISSGAALAAATALALRKENKGKNIVVLFPDSGDRYLSTELFA